jgi:flagellar biosynthesis protein FlhG
MGTQIWAIASGKGGVGKTFLCSNMGITLTKMNKSVLLVDLDSTGANLHTSLGVEISDRNLRSYFENGQKIVDVIQPTPIPRLSYIHGYDTAWSPEQVGTVELQRFVEACRSSQFDYILFDLGTSQSQEIFNILSGADEKIFVVDPEPPTIERFYRYLENYICHSLRDTSTVNAYSKIKQAIANFRKENRSGLFSFRDYLHKEVGFSVDAFDGLSNSPIKIVVNSCRSRQDEELGYSIKSVVQKYFDLNIQFIGSLHRDSSVWQSVRKRKPTLVEKPFTPLAGQLLSICKPLVYSNSDSNFSAIPTKAVV